MGTPTTQSIQRAFDIVELLWRLDGAGPTKIAKELGIHKSTAHVYLQSLESTGYVINDQGSYRLSLQFLNMGSRLKNRSRIFHAARKEINQLALNTDEMAAITVKENNEAVILHQMLGNNSLELGTFSGMRNPLHTTASGRAILAYLPAEEVQSLLHTDLEAVTKNTTTDPDQLLDQFEQIREDGFAITSDQQAIGMGVIAVPLLIDDYPVASLGIAVPSARIKNEDYQIELLQKLKEYQNRIIIKYQ
jgi:DNA-binding IclR family transcriptional regulator